MDLQALRIFAAAFCWRSAPVRFEEINRFEVNALPAPAANGKRDADPGSARAQ